MFQPYFSKAAIQRLEPVIKAKVSRMVEQMRESGKNDQSVNLSYAYRCLTIDIITDYCFAKSFDAIEAKDFKFPVAHAMAVLSRNARFEKYLPWISSAAFHLISTMPLDLLRRLSPELLSVRALQDVSLVSTHC